MNNKKGFTLVELLAVIVILAILVTIAVPATLSISDKLKVNMYCKKIGQIETQAKLYGEDIIDSLTTTGINITVKTLVDKGYVKKDQESAPYVVDPRDSKTDSLYNMSFKLYKKNKRAYVDFNNTVKQTCGLS